MGRRVGGSKEVQTGGENRGMETHAEGIVLKSQNPDGPACLWRAISAERAELCAGERNGCGIPVWSNGREAGIYCDADRHRLARCGGLSRSSSGTVAESEGRS